MDQQQEATVTRQHKGNKFITAIVLGLIAIGFFMATVTGLFF
jgi:hypothetical protein